MSYYKYKNDHIKREDITNARKLYHDDVLSARGVCSRICGLYLQVNIGKFRVGKML